MRKTMHMLSAGALLLLASCGGKKEGNGGGSATTKKNLEVSEAIGKCFETKDFSKLGDYLAADFIDYAGMTGPVKGLDENKKAFEQMAAMMDSSTMRTIVALGNDEYTMTWMEMKGKMKADAMGMKAGQWINAKTIEITQFRDGKATAHWTYMDQADMAKMSNMPPPSAEVPATAETVADPAPKK